jgi:hypothetical protein
VTLRGVVAAAGRRLVPLVLIASALVVATPPAPAHAAAIPGVGDCKPAPRIDIPGTGVTGWFGRPDHIPPPEDPFAAGAKTTIYEQYGLAGMIWWTYDPGCGGDIRDPSAWSSTWLGNILLVGPKFFTALTLAVTDAAFHPTFMRKFDGLVVDVTGALTTGVLKVGLPLTIAFLGLAMTWWANTRGTAPIVSAAGWAVIVMVAGMALIQYPVQASHGGDTAIVTTAGGIATAVNDPTRTGAGDASGKAGQILYNSVLYQQWTTGVFGSADSATAKKYGPLILKSTALSWHEADVLDKDPAAGKKIIDQKQKDFKKWAAEIEESDPIAYDHLKGEYGDRWGMGALAIVAALCCCPFLLAAGLVMIGGYLVIRFVIMFAPGIVTLGVAQPFSGIVIGARDALFGAVFNAVLFAAGAAVTVKVLGFMLLDSGMPTWLAVLLSGVTSWMMWRMLRPLRTARRMYRGRNPIGDALGAEPPPGAQRLSTRARKAAFRFAGRTASSYVGNWAALRTAAKADEAKVVLGPADREPAPYRGDPGERYEAWRRPGPRALPYEPSPGPRRARPHGGAPPRAPAGGLPAAESAYAASDRPYVDADTRADVPPPRWAPRRAAVVGDTYVIFDPDTGTSSRTGTTATGGGGAEPPPRRTRPGAGAVYDPNTRGVSRPGSGGGERYEATSLHPSAAEWRRYAQSARAEAEQHSDDPAVAAGARRDAEFSDRMARETEQSEGLLAEKYRQRASGYRAQANDPNESDSTRRTAAANADYFDGLANDGGREPAGDDSAGQPTGGGE